MDHFDQALVDNGDLLMRENDGVREEWGRKGWGEKRVG